MRSVGIFLITIFLTGTIAGQDKKNSAERENREQLRQEHERRVADLAEQQAELQNPAPRFIDNFVGVTGNNWAVSLVSEGGFFGFRTIAAMNSEKKAYCGFNDDALILADVPSDLFDKIQAFVDRPPLGETGNREKVAACRDCSTESIVVSVRSGGSIRSLTFGVSDSAPTIFRLYEAMYDFKGCQNSTLH